MKAQKGFTLVELMVAMLLGLIISGAALQLFLTNQRTFAVQQAQSGLAEDGHMIIRYITADLRNAGAAGADIGTVNPVILDRTDNGTGGGNDTITVTHLSQWDYCQGVDLSAGGTNPEGEWTEITYNVRDETLFCTSDQPVTGTGETAMISGVESFQILYGVDREADEELAITEYITGSALEPEDVIAAIRLGLVLRSDNNNLPVPEGANTFQVLDETHTVSTADKALRRSFDTTVHIRNHHWEDI